MTYPNSPGYASGSATSRMAAEQLTGRGEIVMAVLRRLYVAANTGRTVDELKASIEATMERTFDRTTIGARVTELQALGYVQPTNDTRKTPRGRQATVFKITVKGMDYCLNN